MSTPETPASLSGVELIAAERARQTSQEGWTPEHDDEHAKSELVDAAGCYAEAAIVLQNGMSIDVVLETPELWPWAFEWWKPSADPVRNLVKAGALIAAEIDRIQRAKGANE